MAGRAAMVGSDERMRTTATRLRGAIGAFRRRTHETKAEGLVTAPQLAALSRLEREGALTTAELARREQITPQGMGATVAVLQELGLVERRADPDDGRRAILTITSDGVGAIASTRGTLVDRIAGALSQSFTADEVATLDAAAELLERLAKEL